MIVGRISLCFLMAGLLCTPTAFAGPDTSGVSEDAVQDVMTGLLARKAERRTQALRDLASLISVDPQVGVRALRRLKEVLRMHGPDERALVMPLLVRIPDKEARRIWLDRLDPEEEPDDRVLAAAVDATRQVRDDRDVTRALLKAARAERASPAQRALAIEALGWMNGPAAALVLCRAHAGETWVEAAARALALGRRKTPRSIPPLLDLLEHDTLGPRVHAWESLVRLTGRNFPMEIEPWRAWWEKQQDKSKMPPRPQPKQAGDRYALPKPLHVPHYYDIPIPRTGSRVVFCLDASQSMYGAGIDDARKELGRTLMDFPSTHAFEIVVFNENTRPYRKRLVKAHPVQKHLAIQWLAEIEPTSYTNLYDSVELAFGHAGRGPRAVANPEKIDMIFLLSDGAPNRGRHRTPARVIKHIAKLSKREIPVHTIGAGEEVFPLLQAIARETGGKFVDAFE